MGKINFQTPTKKLFILSGIIFLSVFLVYYWFSGFGKCRLGENLYFKNLPYEQCAKIGTKIDPPPLSDMNYFLKIIKSPWSGWPNPETHLLQKIEPEEQNIALTQYEQIIPLMEFGGKHSLTVKEFNDEYIQLYITGLGVLVQNDNFLLLQYRNFRF